MEPLTHRIVMKPGDRVWLRDLDESNLVLGEVIGIASTHKNMIISTAFKRVVRTKGKWKFCTAILHVNLDREHVRDYLTKDIAYFLEWTVQSRGLSLDKMYSTYDTARNNIETWVLKTSNHEANYR